MKKNPLWKQKTPVDQLTELVNAVAGNIDNLGQGVPAQRIKNQCSDLTQQILDLRYFLENPGKWNQEF